MYLGKVPFDGIYQETMALRFQIFIDWVSVRAVNLGLFSNQKLLAISFNKRAHCIGISRLLSGKLITGKQDDLEALLPILFLKLLELFVVVLGVTTLAGYIDDQEDLGAETGQRDLFLVMSVPDCEIVNGSGIGGWVVGVDNCSC